MEFNSGFKGLNNTFRQVHSWTTVRHYSKLHHVIQRQLTNTNGPATKRIMFSSVQLNNPEATMNKLVERFTAVLLIIQLPQVRIWFTCISILSRVYTPNLGIYHKAKLQSAIHQNRASQTDYIYWNCIGFRFITATITVLSWKRIIW